MAFIELKDLEKHFGEIIAVDGVNLEIEEGEFMSVLGPSGSGKTTVLRMVAGFETPTSGRIFFDGKDMTGVPPEDRDTSMIFQRLALFPHMTVSENISFGLKHQTDQTSAEVSENVTRVLSLVDLEGYEDRRITELSGGEQQRVALARAIVVEPKLLLYDEPLSDLDRQLREDMRREVRNLHRQLEITSLYVTHNQREALTLSDRIAVMKDGEFVRVGTPHEIYSDPQTEFVANFVGDSNFLRGRLSSTRQGYLFENDIVTLPIEDDSELSTGDATLFVRPENMGFTEDDNESSVDCTVQSSVHLGSVTEYRVRVGDTEMMVVDLGAPTYSAGDKAKLHFKQYDILKG